MCCVCSMSEVLVSCRKYGTPPSWVWPKWGGTGGIGGAAEKCQTRLARSVFLAREERLPWKMIYSCRKNSHILPTGQWFAPSAVINDALIMPDYARACQSMPECARLCQSMPVYARVCQSMPEYAIVCQSMP